MTDLFKLFLGVLASLLRSSAKLEAENLILRQQINVLRRQAAKRPHLNNTDRLLASCWVSGVLALAIAQSCWQTEGLG